MDWPVSSVVGNVAPEMSNPVPVRLNELIVRVAVPDDVKVSALVDVVFMGTEPKARALSLTANWRSTDAELTT